MLNSFDPAAFIAATQPTSRLVSPTRGVGTGIGILPPPISPGVRAQEQVLSQSSEIASKWATHETELQAQLRTLTEINDDLRTARRALLEGSSNTNIQSMELDNVNQEIFQFEEQLQELRPEVASLRESVDIQKSETAKLSSTVAALEEEHRTNVAAVVALQKDSTNSREILSSLDLSVEEATQHFSSMESMLELDVLRRRQLEINTQVCHQLILRRSYYYSV